MWREVLGQPLRGQVWILGPLRSILYSLEIFEKYEIMYLQEFYTINDSKSHYIHYTFLMQLAKIWKGKLECLGATPSPSMQ